MKTFNKKSGSLLLELLIVIGVIAIIMPVVAQVVIASLNSNKWSAENKIGVNLVDETNKAVENISFEKWQNIYGLLKDSSSHYYAIKSNGSWIVATGDENLTINGLSYTRYFTVSNVCRDDLAKSIVVATSTPPCTSGNSDDPSTQKITVQVSWRSGTISKDYYLTRWRNQVCNQTNWSGLASGPVNCPSTVYDSASSIDTNSVPGSLKLQSN